MSLQLLVLSGPDKGRTLTLQAGPDLMLGRGDKAFYKVTDPRVSRGHCQVLVEGDEVTVVCAGGSGGTFVNGAKVSRHALQLGDVLKVGETELRLLMGHAGADDTVPPAKHATRPAAGAGKVGALLSLSGQTLSRFDVGPVIGTGRSSVVFHATDTKDNRSVAFKVLQPEFSQDEDEMQRFVRAIKTMLPLRHPNLVALYGAGKTGPYCWVAMEYIAGENMQQVIGRIGVAGMLDWRYGFKVAVHVGRALQYAHEQSILHRNVTPTNILLQATDKVVKLGDLTLAKALEGVLAQQITRPGEIVGDVTYLSPEGTRGTGELDARSDLYGLGATVYALLTGRPPFDGATLVEKVTKIRQNEPERPTKFQMSIPSRFESVVLKLLAKKPENRYQTAAELLAELDKIAKLQNVTV